VRRRHPNAFLVIDRLQDLVADAGEQVSQDRAIILLIFDNEDALAHAARASSTRTARVKQNREPLPGSDSTQMRPWCISTIRLAIARPSPVPPLARVLELSTW